MIKLLITLQVMFVITVTIIIGAELSHADYHYDHQSGNMYNVTRIGNMTFTTGYNANTGSNWSQTTMPDGSQTGINKNGHFYSKPSTMFGAPAKLPCYPSAFKSCD